MPNLWGNLLHLGASIINVRNMTDKQLLKAVTSFRFGLIGNNSSSLMCMAVSAPLQGFLYVCGINTELINGGIDGIWCNHVWLKMSDGRIIDATADQFNETAKSDKMIMPKVYIGERPTWYLDEPWQPSYAEF